MPGLGHFRLSRLMIGTVQFGQNYGIANRSGTPAYSEICAMLEEAAAEGVNCLDTACSDGNSEEVLGQALADTGLRDFFFIVTKTDHSVPEDASAEEAGRHLRRSLEQSLRRLKVEHLPLVLLHRDTSPVHLEALAACRDSGLIGKCGVSFASPANAQNLLSHPELEAVQAPVNVLDRRFAKVIRSAQQQGAFVFARSTFLQGLLLMNNAATPAHLDVVRGDRAFFHKLAWDLDLTPAALLLRATIGRGDVDCVVVGMETRTQLRENLRIIETPHLPKDVMNAIAAFQPSVPEWLLDPSEWEGRTVQPA
ncbi:MAG TPA: aldo/keto reductase [Terrimicrobiaceae bacterium]|nr:aldo/keto reductase [Terrimicrobiaceae bacterium]